MGTEQNCIHVPPSAYLIRRPANSLALTTGFSETGWFANNND